MRIESIVSTVGLNGFAHKDLAGIKTGAPPNGFFYDGKAVTPGFREISQTGRVLSVMLKLSDGLVAFGDCLDVIFAGAAGRDRLFDPDEHVETIRTVVAPLLVGREVSVFRHLAEEVDALTVDGKSLHTALRYGLSQALLHASSLARRQTMAQVIAEEYGTTPGQQRVPILVSIPKTDPFVLDRMIMKQAELLPHASFTVVEADLGRDGGKLIDYAASLSRRIDEVGAPDYRPTIHLDTYGTIGELFDCDISAIVGYLARVEAAAAPYRLFIESPIVAATMEQQISHYRELREAIRAAGLSVRVIVDEWCNTLDDIRRFGEAGAADFVQIKAPDLGGLTNTIEAINYCRSIGLGCCLGGTANDTDQAARITSHIGIACGPDFLLGKPGLGGDAALMLMRNEMERTITLHRVLE